MAANSGREVHKRIGCDGWPIANPDGTVTCACGRRTWPSEGMLEGVRRAMRARDRRERLARVWARLRAFRG